MKGIPSHGSLRKGRSTTAISSIAAASSTLLLTRVSYRRNDLRFSKKFDAQLLFFPSCHSDDGKGLSFCLFPHKKLKIEWEMWRKFALVGKVWIKMGWRLTVFHFCSGRGLDSVRLRRIFNRRLGVDFDYQRFSACCVVDDRPFFLTVCDLFYRRTHVNTRG